MTASQQDWTVDELRAALKHERLAQYSRLRGGYPIPIAGALYWLLLGVLGYSLELQSWTLVAFYGSGMIFPVAVILSKIFNIPFMKDQSPVGSVLGPAFIGMLLFWVFIIAAGKTAPTMVPLILAVGLSMHWPVIGWSYGRTVIYSAHAVIRAVLAIYIWIAFPEHQLTWLPFSVAAVYIATVIIIYIDSGRMRTKLRLA